MRWRIRRSGWIPSRWWSCLLHEERSPGLTATPERLYNKHHKHEKSKQISVRVERLKTKTKHTKYHSKISDRVIQIVHNRTAQQGNWDEKVISPVISLVILNKSRKGTVDIKVSPRKWNWCEKSKTSVKNKNRTLTTNSSRSMWKCLLQCTKK